MEKSTYEIIKGYSKKIIETSELLSITERHFSGENFEIHGGYRSFVSCIMDFCSKGFLVPIKSSGTNGRNPMLFNRYKITLPAKKEKPGEELLNELQSIPPRLDKGYYFKNHDAYEKDRKYILMLSDYLLDNSRSSSLKYRCTMIVRWFEIFNDEKFLEYSGKVLIKRLGLSLQDLNCYKTLEAFFYILFEPKERLNVLIIENKDTFYSVLKYIERKPQKELYGVNIDMLIYGEGKKIVSSFGFINEVAAGTAIERVYYFGDLDFEGIGIFNSLASKYGKYFIIPHVRLYNELLIEAKTPPALKTNQSEVYLELFLRYFDNDSKDKISRILYNGKYIPQEALNFGRKKGF